MKKIRLDRLLILGAFIILTVVIVLEQKPFTKELIDEDILTLRVAAYGNYKVNEFFNEAIDEYLELNPKIRVVYQVAPIPIEARYFQDTGFVPGYEHRLLAEFSAGDPPDIFYIPKGRGLLWYENGALIELNEYLDMPKAIDSKKAIYGITVGVGFAGIASKTQNPAESFRLLKFLGDYWEEHQIKFEEAVRKETEKITLPGSGLDGTVEEFMLIWNQVALTMNRDDLFLIPRPLVEVGSFGTSFRTPDDYNYLFISVMSYDNGQTISNAGISFKNKVATQSKYLKNFTDCVEILLKTIDPVAREMGTAEILKGLGVDIDQFNLDFFYMTGFYHHNDIQYNTRGPNPDNEHSEYNISVSKPEEKFMWHRSYRTNVVIPESNFPKENHWRLN